MLSQEDRIKELEGQRAAWQKNAERCMEKLHEAIKTIDALAEQQAMDDDWWKAERDRLKAMVDGATTDSSTYMLDKLTVLDALEALRLAPVYVLKDSHPKELGEDFKPHKWDGYEIEFANRCHAAHQALMTACLESVGLEV